MTSRMKTSTAVKGKLSLGKRTLKDLTASGAGPKGGSTTSAIRLVSSVSTSPRLR